MSVLRVLKRRCKMCDIEVDYNGYLEMYKEEIANLSVTSEKLYKVWDDLTIPFFCNDCIQHSRLDVDLCEPDQNDNGKDI